jgi:hypothetical protein
MATTASVGKAIGTIKLVIGDVKIKGVDGVERIAQVGEKVFAKEILITAANAVVQVQLENGNLLDLGRNTQLALDEDMLAGGAATAGTGAAPAAAAAAAQQDVAAIQAAIAAGVDPTKIAEATAAGGAPGAGGATDGGSHEPLVIAQAAPTQAVTAGYPTIPLTPPLFTQDTNPLLFRETNSTSVTLSTANVNENQPGVTFTATLSSPGTTDVVLTTNLGNITIPAGQTVGTLFVATLDPDVYVDPSSLTATVTGVTGGEFDSVDTSAATATAQIVDTIDVTTVAISTANVTENDPSVTFTVTLSNPGETAVTVVTSLGNVVIAAGQTTGTLVINTADPDVYVDPSSITATVTGVSGGNFEAVSFSGATATANIVDTIDVTTVALSTANVTENDPSVTFTATLSNPGETAVTVTTSLGNIVIAAGQTSGTLVINTLDPDVYVDPSSITATVTGVSGGNFEAVNFTGATATAQIVDTIDATTVAISTANVTENDPSVTFTVTLSNPGETAVTVATSLGNVSIAAGQTTGTLVINTADPDVYVDPDSITATVTGVSGGNFEAVSFAGASATAQIGDVTDTVTATLTASPTSIFETGGDIVYTITLTGSPGAIDPDTNLVFSLANGEQVTILAGQTSGSVTHAYTDAEITTQANITNSITGVASGGTEYENLVTAGTVTTDVDYKVHISNLTPAADGGDVVVNEDDLLANRGTGESAGSDQSQLTTQPGTFNITAPDGVDDLTIDGHAVITNGVFNTTSFTTSLGNTLAVTGYDAATGEVSYTYTLNDNEAHAAANGENNLFDNLTVVLTDINGNSDTDTLSAQIIDDVPSVTITDSDGSPADGATSVAEDAANISGAWTLVKGADGVTSVDVTVGASMQTLLLASSANTVTFNTASGDLVVKADGTWTFDPKAVDNDDATPDTVSFTVKATDADNDVSQDSQTVTVLDGAGPSAGDALSLTVDDQNLADGSTPAGADFSSGTISFTAGSDALTSFAFSTTLTGLDSSLTWTRVSATEIRGADERGDVIKLELSAPGSIAVGATGTVTVTATLLDNYDTHPTFTADDLKALGSVAVVAADNDGDSTSQTVSVSVSDDVPVITSVVSGFIANDDVTLSQGSVINLTVGADQPGAITTLTGTAPQGLTYLPTVYNSDGSATLTATALDSQNQAYTVYTLTVQANGQYTFDMVSPNPVSSTTTPLTSLTAGSPVDVLAVAVGNYFAIFTGDGDDAGTGTNDSNRDGIKSSSDGLGIQNNILNETETLFIKFATDATGTNDVDVFNVSFMVGNMDAGDVLNWEVYNDGVFVDSGTFIAPNGINSSVNNPVDLQINNTFDELRITAPDTTENTSLKFVDMTVTRSLFTETQTLPFNVTLTDADGDTASTTLPITLVGTDATGYHFTGTSGADAMQGSASVDIMIGGGGNDILTGGDGSDIFKYNALSDGTDQIVDFNTAAPASGGDVLDISGLLDLSGNTWADGGTLATAVSGGYVSFTNSGGKVQINVDIDPGVGAGPVAVAVLQNVAYPSSDPTNALVTLLSDNVKLD